MERHQQIALGLFTVIAAHTSLQQGFSQALAKNLVLAAFLAPILFYRLVAYLAGFGFPEVFARDYKSENHPGPYALFFWMLYLIACGFVVFDRGLY